MDFLELKVKIKLIVVQFDPSMVSSALQCINIYGNY